MRQRPLLLLLGLGLGLAALLWGVLSLQRIFAGERADAHEALALTRRTLAEQARSAVAGLLARRLAAAGPRLEAARSDPLAPAVDLVYFVEGEQILPRPVRYAADGTSAARELYRRLADAPATVAAEGPWAERIAALVELERAVAAGDEPAIVASVRGLLNHRLRYVLPVTAELPQLIRFVEVLVAGASPEPALLQALLCDGLRASGEQRVEALQTMLIASRERFSRADFAYLSERLVALSRRAEVPYEDFAAAAASAPTPPIDLDLPLAAPAIARGRYHVEPLPDRGARGLGVDLAAVVAEVEGSMRADGRLGAEARIVLAPALAPVVALTALSLAIESPRWAAAGAAVERRYRLKSALGMALGGLAAVIVALVGSLYRSERRLLESRGEFVAAVSHELRTPLAGIRVMAETLARRPDGARDFPGRIVDQVDRLSFLVENILSFNRLEKQPGAARRSEVGLAELVAHLEQESSAFTDKEVAISLRGDTRIEADPELIRLLFSNLLSNACKYNERERVEVEIAAAPGDRHLTFTDNGFGIPEADRDRVFVEFFRARGAERAPGFGLGLAICRRIMALHDGTIRIAHSGPEGTTFELVFG